MQLDGSRDRADAARTKTEHPGIRFSCRRSSHQPRDPASDRYEREDMLQNGVQSKSAKSLRLIGILRTRLRRLPLSHWASPRLCLLRPFTRRNIRVLVAGRLPLLLL